MQIEELLKQPEIQQLLEDDNLDEIYQKIGKGERPELTEFLEIEARIDPLNYLSRIPNYMYYELDVVDINIPNNIKSIGAGAFTNCSDLQRITIPDSVTSISYGAFSGCTSLESVVIPNSVTYIGDSTFSGCTSLTSITIPNSIARDRKSVV